MGEDGDEELLSLVIVIMEVSGRRKLEADNSCA
jgi:hypothetical protein